MGLPKLIMDLGNSHVEKPKAGKLNNHVKIIETQYKVFHEYSVFPKITWDS